MNGRNWLTKSVKLGIIKEKMGEDLHLGYCIALAQKIGKELKFTICPEHGYSYAPTSLLKWKEENNLHPNYHIIPVDLKNFQEECEKLGQPMFVCT